MNANEQLKVLEAQILNPQVTCGFTVKELEGETIKKVIFVQNREIPSSLFITESLKVCFEAPYIADWVNEDDMTVLRNKYTRDKFLTDIIYNQFSTDIIRQLIDMDIISAEGFEAYRTYKTDEYEKKKAAERLENEKRQYEKLKAKFEGDTHE